MLTSGHANSKNNIGSKPRERLRGGVAIHSALLAASCCLTSPDVVFGTGFDCRGAGGISAFVYKLLKQSKHFDWCFSASVVSQGVGSDNSLFAC